MRVTWATFESGATRLSGMFFQLLQNISRLKTRVFLTEALCKLSSHHVDKNPIVLNDAESIEAVHIGEENLGELRLSFTFHIHRLERLHLFHVSGKAQSLIVSDLLGQAWVQDQHCANASHCLDDLVSLLSE